MAVTIQDIEQALQRIRPILAPTQLAFSQSFSNFTGRDVFIKWENKLRTGSFKERGAISVLTLLTEEQKKKGVCAASAGNHALALSYHAARMKVPCTIVMPTTAPLVKVESTQKTGAEVILFGNNFDEAYDYCLKLAAERGIEFVSAFDDERVVAGQGTSGLEIMEQLSSFDAVIVPVGGGGLMGGIATAIKAKRKEVLTLGVYSEWATHAKKDLAAGVARPALPSATIADGIAVKRAGKITQPILDAVVDKKVTVSESEIARAIVKLLEFEKTVVEGAGAAGIAALLAGALPPECKRVVVLVCGSNIDMNVLSRLLERDMAERGRLLNIRVSVPDRPGSLHFTTGIVARAGANILHVLHDRSFSREPSNVDITLELEVRNKAHKETLLQELAANGIEAQVTD
jgi:threonine dehydratase